MENCTLFYSQARVNGSVVADASAVDADAAAAVVVHFLDNDRGEGAFIDRLIH